MVSYDDDVMVAYCAVEEIGGIGGIVELYEDLCAAFWQSSWFSMIVPAAMNERSSPLPPHFITVTLPVGMMPWIATPELLSKCVRMM